MAAELASLFSGRKVRRGGSRALRLPPIDDETASHVVANLALLGDAEGEGRPVYSSVSHSSGTLCLNASVDVLLEHNAREKGEEEMPRKSRLLEVNSLWSDAVVLGRAGKLALMLPSGAEEARRQQEYAAVQIQSVNRARSGRRRVNERRERLEREELDGAAGKPDRSFQNRFAI